MPFLLELSNAMILKSKQHTFIKSRLSTTFAHEFLVLKTLLYVIYMNWRSRRTFCKCVLKTVPIPLFSQAIFTSFFAVSDGRPFEPTQIKTFYELVLYTHIYEYFDFINIYIYQASYNRYKYCRNQRQFLNGFIFFIHSVLGKKKNTSLRM